MNYTPHPRRWPETFSRLCQAAAGRTFHFLLLLPLLLPLNSAAHESQTCAATIGELRVMLGDQAFPLKWEEATMDDGKPLVVSILEKNGSLFLEFIKT
ncbi:MAG: hypothetical protein Q8O38_17180, partial [Sulfurimicrobium sp.]|nr:hypothetical protein [Sulfurimicrobium sp.]